MRLLRGWVGALQVAGFVVVCGCGDESDSNVFDDPKTTGASTSGSSSTSKGTTGGASGGSTNGSNTGSMSTSQGNASTSSGDDGSGGSGGGDGGNGASSGQSSTRGSESSSSGGSASSTTGGSDDDTYSEVFTGGQFHLGPVDWEQSEWYNSCSPYPELIQEIEGDLLAGLELTHNGEGQLCDACVKLTADTGKTVVARVITTGVTTKNSIDLSPAAFEALDSGEYPRSMSWQVVKCPDTGNIYYQFQTEANVWWTSLWVRNPRIPIEKVEVQSSNHSGWFALQRGSDGTYTDASGFGEGQFTIRVTAVDGQTIEDTFQSLEPGALLESSGNFE